MKLKIYFVGVLVFCFLTPQLTKANTYYSDPTSSSVTIASGTNACSGWSTSASGPFSTATITLSDNVVVQVGSTVTTSGSSTIFCANLTLNGTLISSTAVAVLKFSGLFSGNGTLSGSTRIGNNGAASTLSFNGLGTNGITLYTTITLAGNTVIGGAFYFNTASIYADLAGFDLTAGSITGGSGITSGGGTATSNNYVLIKGNPSSNVIVNGASNLYFDQTNSGITNALNSLTVNTSGASIYTPLMIYGYINHTSSSSFNFNVPGVSPTSVNTTGSVTFMSTTTGTAYLLCPNAKIFASGGAGSATITVQQYLSAKRGWRLLGNPTGTAQTLTTFATNSNIDLNNGTNIANTVYSYDGTQVSPVTPWVTAGTSWSAFKGLLFFVRGTAGQGIGGGAYSPGNVTLSAAGNLVKGTLTAQNLTYDAANTNAQWNVIANPYPCPVSAKALTGLYNNSNINQSIYYVSANYTSSNAYAADGNFSFQTLDATHDFIIPSFGSILVQTQASGQTIQFTETSKYAGSGSQTLFGVTDTKKIIELELQDNNANALDRLQVMLDANSKSTGNDHWDLPKLSLNNLYMYTLSSDNQKLAIDARNVKSNENIPVGIQIHAPQSYSFKINQCDLPDNFSVFLKDNLLRTSTPVSTGVLYKFSVTSDTTTFGDGRFVLVLKPNASSISFLNSENTASVLSVYPNPASSTIYIQWPKQNSVSNAVVKILNLSGRLI
jgi:hypothetical protein